jgi:hypothetical protein
MSGRTRAACNCICVTSAGPPAATSCMQTNSSPHVEIASRGQALRCINSNSELSCHHTQRTLACAQPLSTLPAAANSSCATACCACQRGSHDKWFRSDCFRQFLLRLHHSGAPGCAPLARHRCIGSGTMRSGSLRSGARLLALLSLLHDRQPAPAQLARPPGPVAHHLRHFAAASCVEHRVARCELEVKQTAPSDRSVEESSATLIATSIAVPNRKSSSLLHCRVLQVSNPMAPDLSPDRVSLHC